MVNKENLSTEEIVETVIEGVHKKKGMDVVSMDFSSIENAVCEFFIICHGDSNTQVEAIADSVYENVQETHHIKPWHKEGVENATWVLLDYGDIIVHIFQKEFRDLYKLEELWADANIKHLKDI